MNLILLTADTFHVLSFFFILYKIFRTQNVIGISRNTQDLILCVFLLRYVDLAWNFVSAYNSFMQVFCIFCSAMVSIYMRIGRCAKTYEVDRDRIKKLYIFVPCALAAIFIEFYEYLHVPLHLFLTRKRICDYMWTTSLLVEAFAIIPQLYLSQTYGVVENLTSHYMASLGMYRALYTINWIYRSYYENHPTDTIVWGTGIVQSCAYADFFYFYCKTKKKGLSRAVKITDSAV